MRQEVVMPPKGQRAFVPKRACQVFSGLTGDSKYESEVKAGRIPKPKKVLGRIRLWDSEDWHRWADGEPFDAADHDAMREAA